MTQRSRRFQTRALKDKDDGADFEDFVFECFRVAKEELCFSKRLARGRDGAVDLIDGFSEPGAATVAECKYVGSGKANDAKARWREVYKNLKKNLPPLNRDPSKNPKSPYRAWLDPERPITRYRFCVTTPMSNAEIRTLEKHIASDFAKLAEDLPQLHMLAHGAGAIRVLPWDWFDAELNEHPSLSFRWFGGLPPGVESFAKQAGAESTFRNFLNSGELQYFSRDEYAGEGVGHVERGEAELAARLAGDDGAALLITGPGGVGKTRLSLELAGALADAEYGFDIYQLRRSATFDSITKLAAHYPRAASILLLIDYAEAAPRLLEIAEAIQNVRSSSGHRLRLIATCRASATNQVKDAVSALPFEEKSLSSARTGEEDYVRWVARSILALEAIPDALAIERVCHGVPALAAFAIFLFRRHRGQFDAQFGALHGLADFETWASQRIAALTTRLGGDPSIGRTLARVALTLPLSADAFEGIAAESPQSRSLLRALIDDCWIERDGDCYAAAHDVLADALTARWLLETDHTATDRAADLLREAAERKHLAGALIVLERLALHPKLIEIDGTSVVNELLARHLEETLRCCGILLGGSLLSFQEKLDLLHRSEAIREALKNQIYDVGLSFLAAEAVYRGLSVGEAPALSTLVELLDGAVGHPHRSNMILRRAYALDPHRFRARAFANVAEFPLSEPTHFLLTQMLRSGEPAETLDGAVRLWSAGNAKEPRASFVYAAWLNAKGSIEAVSEPLLAWVSENGQALKARFVYHAWLERGGSIEAVEKPLIAWITQHAITPDARFLYQAWLDRGGSTEAVEKPLLAWVAAHGDAPEARFVYQPWLDRGGSIEAVEKPLLAWVTAHGTTPEASFVYQPWLDRGGSIEAVEKPLLAWMEAHGTELQASHVYNSLLDRGGSIEAVGKPLLAWVAEHGTEPEASHVYKAWLDRGGSIEMVEKPLLAWTAAQGSTRDASHVYRAWLNRAGNFEAVRDQIYNWVVLWRREADAAFVTRHLCKRLDLPEAVILSIASWSVAFPDHEDSLDRLATLVAHTRESTLSLAGFLKLIALTEDAIAAALDRDRLSALDRLNLWKMSASLAREPMFGFNPRGCLRTIAAVIKSGRVFRQDITGPGFLLHTYDRMLNVALNAVCSGDLSTERDAAALRAFTDWLWAGDPEIEGWERLLKGSGPSPRN